ncbi:hypothetical protein [Labedella endophytica]|uniref:DUF998 domain-containing protein n=1 Tax=Labedella endophytica TaxID=1523160 RepID=A0A3S0VG42_9MICO|nr:hypothetical protein [Labedella endophytica]RUR00889.1 hypothetical protein ELQ94_04910 [Labedella endophytica]
MTPAILFSAASLSYVANCAVGAGVATSRIDTSDVRWVHHALYVSTSTLTAVAVSSAWWGRPRSSSRAAAALLAPAAVPLALIPFLGTHSNRHMVVALAAAPFVLAGLIRSWR